MSIASFGMLFGSLIAGPMANFIGRKWTCILGTCLSLTLGYALIPFAQYVWMIYLGRFFNGVGLGFSLTVSTLYIMEISTPNMRQGLAVVPAIAGTLGVLTCQCLGAVLNWRWLSITLTCLNAPFLLMLIFIPETPVYLIGTEQIERAHKVLRMLRGRQWDITKELTDLKVASEGTEKHRMAVSEIISSSVIKPFLMSLVLMFFFQFSGINIILQYTVDIFQTAESSINEFMANIFLGLALLTSNIISLFIASKMRRRLMLLLSSMGISLSLIAMGVYFYLKSQDSSAADELTPIAEKLLNDVQGGNSLNSISMTSAVKNEDYQQPLELENESSTENSGGYLDNFGWLPLFLLMLYIFFFNIGYGAMIWITVAEILPQHVRSVTNSLSVGFTCVCSFLTSHTYMPMKESLKAEGVFWLYGGFSLLGFMFILIFVPETRNKSEAEIQEYFLSSSQRRARDNNQNNSNIQNNENGQQPTESANETSD